MITSGLPTPLRLRPAPAALAPGQRVYAIGDVHGCLDRLQALHGLIADDLARRPVAHALLIHLGDLIDRGPDSAGVIRHLIQPFAGHPGVPPPHCVTLLGNHEDMLLDALDSGSAAAAAHWRQNGGSETLASWNLTWRDPPQVWAARIPPAELGFLRGLGLLHRVGGYVFTHAGLRPGVALAQQSRRDLLWIREPFLSSPMPFESVVVHGHTPEDQPTVTTNRIGIDTGAVLGGRLTCLVLQEATLGFLQS
jgi:serine/threonine protein phosphatase 1